MYEAQFCCGSRSCGRRDVCGTGSVREATGDFADGSAGDVQKQGGELQANGTGAQLTVKAGKNTLILEPGKSTDFTLASGDEVVAKTRTKQYDEGQVLVT